MRCLAPDEDTRDWHNDMSLVGSVQSRTTLRSPRHPSSTPSENPSLAIYKVKTINICTLKRFMCQAIKSKVQTSTKHWLTGRKPQDSRKTCFLWYTPEHNRDIGDLRRRRAHYNVTVMWSHTICRQKKDIFRIMFCLRPLIELQNPLTYWGQDNMATIFQTTFSNAFLKWKCLSPRGQLTIFQQWFR